MPFIERVTTPVSFMYRSSRDTLRTDGIGFQNPPTPEADVSLANTLLKGSHIRGCTALILNLPHEPLSPSEKLGVVYFVSLVVSADRLMDGNHVTEENGTSFRTQLSRRLIPRTAETVESLEHKLYDNLPASKRNIAATFLDHAMQLHETKGTYFPAGSYGHNEAYDYRQQTTASYVDTACVLAGVEEPYRSDVVHGAMAMQYVDDARDVDIDLKERSYNLFLGMARDHGELGIVTKATRNHSVTSRQTVRAAPQTLSRYREAFRAEAEKLSTPGRRILVRALGKVLM